MVLVGALAAACDSGQSDDHSSSHKPTSKSQQAYLADLRAIDPALAKDHVKAVRNGENACEDFNAGKPGDTVVKDLIESFKGQSKLSGEQATSVIDSASKHLCSTAS